jgi:hypothetical protein
MKRKAKEEEEAGQDAQGEAEGAQDADPETIIQSRSGAVLGRQTILKSDHFPGCQNMKLTPLIDGAPNFRKVPSPPILQRPLAWLSRKP